MSTLKRGTIVIHSTTRCTPRAMGCVCTGPAWGTPYCMCEIAYHQNQPVDDEDDDEFEDKQK